MEKLNQTAKALKARGFLVNIAETSEQAQKLALDLIGEQSVGIGGSITIRDINLYETLQKRGNRVYWHWKAGQTPKDEILNAARDADVYLSSTNAISTEGFLVNIDGAGNRTASMYFGPKTVIIIAGINKICGSTYEDCIQRIKKENCPKNAQRLGRKTPCAVTGKCAHCRSVESMCRVISILEMPPSHVSAFHVILVNETLGY